MNTNVDDIIRRTRSYWYQDGLVEMLSGLFFVSIGLLALGEWATPPDSPWRWVWAPALPVVTLAWILGGRKVIGWLKERITYPRTGYVAYRRPAKSSVRVRAAVAMVIGGAIAVATIASLTYRPDTTRLVPLILGTGVAILMLRINRDLALTRFYVIALWSVVVGGVLGWQTAEMGLSLGLYYALLGMALALGGVVTFVRYLRIPPVSMTDIASSIPTATPPASDTCGDRP